MRKRIRNSNTRFVKYFTFLSIFVLYSLNLNAQCELNDCCGLKAKSLTFQYTGQSCASSDNCQTLDTCVDFGAGPNNDPQVYIEVIGNQSPHGTFTVNNGGVFTVMDNNQLSPELTINIYSETGGVLLQTIEFHASCSEPIVANDQFGSLILLHYLGKNNNGECGSPLPPAPIKWAYFRSQEINKKVVLEWGTEFEINNDGFYVERSFDGRSFESIAFVKGMGNYYERKDYSYTDLFPSGGVNYYRLKQMDLDGSYEFSPILNNSLEIGKYMAVYPNPAFGGTAHLYVNTELNIHSKIDIFTIDGRKIDSLVLDVYVGQNRFDLSKLMLEPGVYIARMTNQGYSLQTKFVIL